MMGAGFGSSTLFVAPSHASKSDALDIDTKGGKVNLSSFDMDGTSESITHVNAIVLLEFPNGSREWWTRMVNGAANRTEAVGTCTVKGELR
jgi:hypothetical protein